MKIHLHTTNISYDKCKINCSTLLRWVSEWVWRLLLLFSECNGNLCGLLAILHWNNKNHLCINLTTGTFIFLLTAHTQWKQFEQKILHPFFLPLSIHNLHRRRQKKKKQLVTKIPFAQFVLPFFFLSSLNREHNNRNKKVWMEFSIIRIIPKGNAINRDDDDRDNKMI